MICRGFQNVSYIRSLCACRTDRILSRRQGNGSVCTDVNNGFRLTGETMHMARRMVVRIGDESNSAKP